MGVSTRHSFISSRRTFLGTLAATPLVLGAAKKHIPIGLELYSVRNELKKDMMGTLQSVGKMGYECVEFFSPYFDWATDYAKEVRKKIDGLGVRCYSTHNSLTSFRGDGLSKAMELNKILGTKFIVLASAGRVEGVDGWKHIAEVLNQANGQMEKDGLHAGYHNHDLEWKPVDGQKPIEILASNTDKSIMLQLDVGTCVETGNDPVAWIEKNPGRIRSLHLKDWSPQKGYRVLFGEGVAPWKKIFAAAESVGGVEYYLIEQEGSDYPELETAERCLVAYKDIHG
jgi:sugar phosphate isomerase/epimerase